MARTVSIAGRKIGEGHPVFIIAELSANHRQSYTNAVKLIKAAKSSGADAVKLQTYTPDTITIDVDNRFFRVDHPEWGGQTLYQLYKKAYTPWKWFGKLKKAADDAGIIFFSTAFDKTSVDFLEELGVPAHKLSSFELVDLPLIEYTAKTKKPLILSTGMATENEIKEAVDTAKKAGAKDIILLKCVSSYPADPAQMNLKMIPHLEKTFCLPVGLSDHGLDMAVPSAAVALGAKVIERHFTLSRNTKSPDSFFSTEPDELKELITNIRSVEKALGKVRYSLSREEKKSRLHRRSLFAVKDIKKGEIFTGENIRSIRPAYGISPKYEKKMIGRRSSKNIKKGTPISFGQIGKSR